MGNEPFRELPQEWVEYLVVFGCNVQDLSKDLTMRAADGYRVVPGSPGTGGYALGLCVVMQRTMITSAQGIMTGSGHGI